MTITSYIKSIFKSSVRDLKQILATDTMEEEIVFYINSQPKEIREKLIEYLKVWNSKDIDEFASRRKKMGSKQFQAQKLSLGEFMTSLLPLEDILKKLENDSQSQSN
jgi:uncharacterized protein (DUF608 family)